MTVLETYRLAVQAQGRCRTWVAIVTSPVRLLGYALETLGEALQKVG